MSQNKINEHNGDILFHNTKVNPTSTFSSHLIVGNSNNMKFWWPLFIMNFMKTDELVPKMKGGMHTHYFIITLFIFWAGVEPSPL
jgi:hypothetical protein